MKAILVIDTPKECCECNLSNAGTSPSDNWCCSGLTVKTKTIYGEYDTRRIIKLEDIHKVQDWCPLKPVHSLKSGGKDYIIYERQFLYDNLDREIEIIKKGKEIYESNISG